MHFELKVRRREPKAMDYYRLVMSDNSDGDANSLNVAALTVEDIGRLLHTLYTHEDVEKFRLAVKAIESDITNDSAGVSGTQGPQEVSGAAQEFLHKVEEHEAVITPKTGDLLKRLARHIYETGPEPLVVESMLNAAYTRGWHYGVARGERGDTPLMDLSALGRSIRDYRRSVNNAMGEEIYAGV